MKRRKWWISVTAAAAITAAACQMTAAKEGTQVYSVVENRDTLTGTADIVLWNLPDGEEEDTQVRVWSLADQSDLTVYPVSVEEGVGRVSFDAAHHAPDAVLFKAEVLRDEDGKQELLSTLEWKMERQAVTVGVEAADESGSGRVFIRGISGLPDDEKSRIRVSLTSTSDPKERVVWYDCQRDPEYGYYADFSLAGETRVGLFEAAAWVFDGESDGTCIGTAPFETAFSDASSAVVIERAGMNGALYEADPSEIRPDTEISCEEEEDARWLVRVRNIPGNGGSLKNAALAVWNTADGQDDLHWYQAEAAEDGCTFTVPVSRHLDAGDFRADVWAFMEDGSGLYAGGCDFTVQREWSVAAALVNQNPSAGTADLLICQDESDYRVAAAQAAIWSEEDKSDLAWYEAEEGEGGVYRIAFDRSRHQLMAEDFHAVIYMTDGTGIRQNVGDHPFRLEVLRPALHAGQKGKGRYAVLEAENVPGAGAGLDEVIFSLYRGGEGGELLGTYVAEPDGASIRAEADLEEFGVEGSYRVEAAASYKNGLRYSLGEESFEAVPIPFEEAAAVLDEIGWNLQAAFRWSAGLTYYGHNNIMPDYDTPGIEWFAHYGFENKKGNCYVMAATFYEMAVDLGYEGRQIAGGVGMRAGGIGPHSWVELDQEDGTWVYDPNFTNESGGNGFKITYGQSGTWSYSMGHAMELKGTDPDIGEEAVTEADTEEITEAVTEADSEESTEAVTEADTEESTEAVTEETAAES